MNSVKNSVEFSSDEQAAELCNGTVEEKEQVNVGRHLCFVHVSIFFRLHSQDIHKFRTVTVDSSKNI